MPATLAFLFLASLIALIKFVLIFFFKLPPPTERIKTKSFLFK
jgi:hypothetical protein